MRWRITTAIAVTALAVSACGSDEPVPVTTPSTIAPTTPATAETAPTAATTPTPATTTPAPSETTTTQPPAAEGVTFTGADGVVTTVTDTSRIVSLNGDLTEIVFALGLGSQVVAVDVTTTYPAETEDLPRVGFGQQLAAEPVIAFNPTVVIGDQQIQPGDSIQQLRDAGVAVVIFETQTTLPGVETKILQVAEVLGVPDAGRYLADRVNQEINEAIALAAGAQEQARVAFVYSRGPQQIFLFGQGTVTQALIEGANAIDTISASDVFAVVPLTPEALVAAAPDVIIVPESGVGALGGLAGIAELPGVAQTPAGLSGSFLVYDDGLFLNFGPRTGEALRTLVLDLYPELVG
jgi:iron complex transport system substrate-binding protein